MMEITGVQVYEGPSIYCHKPVVRVCLQLGQYENIPSNELPGLYDALVCHFPGLELHECSKGYPGGFLERLKEGTYFPHIIEHLCLEIQLMLGYDVKYGKTKRLHNDAYDIVFAYKNREIIMPCVHFIMNFIFSILNKEQFDFRQQLAQLIALKDRVQPGPSTMAIINEAISRGIPVQELYGSGMIRLGYGKKQRMLSATLYEGTSSVAVEIACDKFLTKSILDEIGVPTPAGKLCFSIEDALEAAEALRYPVVVKPKNGNHGNGVFLSIGNSKELIDAFSQLQKQEDEILLEKHIKGRDYRILVINGIMVAAAERIPPHVIGNGMHTIKELIELINSSDERGEGHERPLTRIVMDAHAEWVLEKHGHRLSDIPRINEVVWLRENGNLSTGGMAVNCTEMVHPRNKEYAENAANVIGLDIAGVDIIIPDIREPMTVDYGAIVEVNAAPGIRMHLYPTEGKPINVAINILDMIYPSGQETSVPIVAVTGTNGKTTTTRMISHILQCKGLTVGATTTHGIYRNRECIEEGDTTGPVSAKRILNDRRVDAVVLETARGGILRGGLAYNKADVAVFTNLTADHLGIDGIDTIEELLHLKSLVVEAVKAEGYCVLNADDRWVMKAKDQVKGRIILFGLDTNNPWIQKHIKEGGKAVYCDGHVIYIIDAAMRKELIRVEEIPATLKGILQHNIYNAMAAIAAAYALDIPLNIIMEAMKSFACDQEMNPGRFNVYPIKDFQVILDYGHNYDGYVTTLKGLKALQPKRLVGIIGVPGDRRDEDIRQIGCLCGKQLDRIIIREDFDTRGRKPGEVASILYHAIIENGYPPDEVSIITKETEALKTVLENAQPEDVIIIFFDQLEPMSNLLKEYQNNISNGQFIGIK